MPLQPMLVEEPSQDASAPPRRWQMMELTNLERGYSWLSERGSLQDSFRA
jgi:hypothetical protein